jgi:hypothetical protein
MVASGLRTLFGKDLVVSCGRVTVHFVTDEYTEPVSISYYALYYIILYYILNYNECHVEEVDPRMVNGQWSMVNGQWRKTLR